MVTLELEDNPIGDAGATALVEALRSNTAVMLLSLSENGVSDACKVALDESSQVVLYQ